MLSGASDPSSGPKARGEAGLALVVEGAGDEPVDDEAELCDARARAVEVAAAPPRVGLEEPGVDAREPRARASRRRAERLLDLGRVALIPLRPQLAQRGRSRARVRATRLDGVARRAGARTSDNVRGERPPADESAGDNARAGDRCALRRMRISGGGRQAGSVHAPRCDANLESRGSHVPTARRLVASPQHRPRP